MKKLLFLLCVSCLLLACTPSEVERRGEDIGKRFANAWNADNSRQAVIAEFSQILDSIADDGEKDDFKRAFERAVETENDTIRLAVEAMARPTEKFCSEYATELIDGLLDGKLNAEQANARLNLVLSTAAMVGRDDLAEAFSKDVDNRAAGLSMSKQMKVYAAASSPKALARALKADKAKPGADAKLISEQVETLSDIYTPEQLKEFNDEFNAK